MWHPGFVFNYPTPILHLPIGRKDPKMPRYANHNNHPVNITLSHPNVTITVFPIAWPPSRLPAGAKREVDLDETLARELVKVGMLSRIAEAVKPALTKETVQEVVQEAARQGLVTVAHQEARRLMPTAALPVDERPTDAPAGEPPPSSSRSRRRYA